MPAADHQRALRALKLLREARNLSQVEVAAEMGYKVPSAVSRIERGDTDTRISTIFGFLAAIGADLGEWVQAYESLHGERSALDRTAMEVEARIGHRMQELEDRLSVLEGVRDEEREKRANSPSE